MKFHVKRSQVFSDSQLLLWPWNCKRYEIRKVIYFSRGIFVLVVQNKKKKNPLRCFRWFGKIYFPAIFFQIDIFSALSLYRKITRTKNSKVTKHKKWNLFVRSESYGFVWTFFRLSSVTCWYFCLHKVKTIFPSDGAIAICKFCDFYCFSISLLTRSRVGICYCAWHRKGWFFVLMHLECLSPSTL